MKFSVRWLAAPVAAAMVLVAAPPQATAAPARTKLAAQQQGALILFDPPLGQTLRYRWETVEERRGATTTSWEVSSLRFEAAEDGYRLFVVPESSGNDIADPARKAMLEHFAELTRRPYSVRLDAEGQMLGIENEEALWAELVRTIEAAYDDLATGRTPEVREGLRRLSSVFRDMPAETRRNMMLQGIGPLVEFAGTETRTGEPIDASIEQPAPFGGTVRRNVRITLERVQGDLAHLSIFSEVPAEEIAAAAARVIGAVTGESGGGDAEARIRALANEAEGLRNETRASFRVRLDTGLTEEMRSTESTVAGSGEGRERVLKIVTMRRLD